MNLKTDCRHFPGDKPCRPNKEQGKTCPDCDEYAPKGHRILIIKLEALGDVLRTTAILPGIKAQYPSSYIVWLTLDSAADLLRGNEFIDELWTLDIDAPARLAAEEFDLVLNPDADKRAAGLASQARAVEKRGMLLNSQGNVVPASPEAVAWLEMGAFDSLKKANRKTYQQLIYEMLKLEYRNQEVVFALHDAEKDWAGRFLTAQGWREGETVIGVNLGGGGRWKKKQWKPWHFEALARELAARENTRVLLIGGEREQSLMDNLKALLPAGVWTIGAHRTVRETAALIHRCRLLVSGDSLVFHLATALRVPTVVLMGPTSAPELELYERGELIVAPIGCVCCYLTDCDINPDCMQLITPQTVLGAVKKWL